MDMFLSRFAYAELVVNRSFRRILDARIGELHPPLFAYFRLGRRYSE